MFTGVFVQTDHNPMFPLFSEFQYGIARPTMSSTMARPVATTATTNFTSIITDVQLYRDFVLFIAPSSFYNPTFAVNVKVSLPGFKA